LSLRRVRAAARSAHGKQRDAQQQREQAHAEQAEEERLRREQEAEEERQRQELLARDTAGTQAYYDEIMIFMDALPHRLALRVRQKEEARAAREQWEQERQRRLAARAAGNIH